MLGKSIRSSTLGIVSCVQLVLVFVNQVCCLQPEELEPEAEPTVWVEVVAEVGCQTRERSGWWEEGGGKCAMRCLLCSGAGRGATRFWSWVWAELGLRQRQRQRLLACLLDAWHICWPTTTTTTTAAKPSTSKTCTAKYEYATARRTATAAAATKQQQQPSNNNSNNTCNNGQRLGARRHSVWLCFGWLVSIFCCCLFWGRPACLGYLPIVWQINSAKDTHSETVTHALHSRPQLQVDVAPCVATVCSLCSIAWCCFSAALLLQMLPNI